MQDEALSPHGILGLDEAGRGSLVGPLVVGAFLVPADRVEEMWSMGVRDSKSLSPAQRADAYGRLLRHGRCASVALSPATVDESVRRNELNLLEARAFAQLIRRLRPSLVFADACDPVAGRFGSHVTRLSGGLASVDARHHADRDLVVVGAASIVAKVRRDRAVARLRSELGEELGSGYPSDRRTVEFVRAHLARPGAAPSWIRHSWATIERLKRERMTRTLDSFAP